MVGVEVPNMTFLMCNIFKPTVYQGKICYQVKEKRHKGDHQKGAISGLRLMIDVNSERSIVFARSKKNEKTPSSKQNILIADDVHLRRDKEKLATIHIGTLVNITKHGHDSYYMTGIKKMSGTDKFLAWPEDKRKCSLEKYEDCQLRGFLETTRHCGCAPFHLLPGTEDGTKVIVFSNSILQFIS